MATGLTFPPVLFSLLKAYARIALRIYCRRLVVNKPDYLQAKGPILFAANHPNSFLDGIILTTLMEETVYSLARGDAFAGGRGRWLRRLHLLPVYRTSEGVENLASNYTTFAECHQVFARGGVVLIFSEGLCLNEWHLRPLRKGTARLAISAWQQGIPLTVVPLGFNYSSFRRFGKSVHLNFGKPIENKPVLAQQAAGHQLAQFNQQLQEQLRSLVYEINPTDPKMWRRHFVLPVPIFRRVLLMLPAALGWLLHVPLYFPVRVVAGLPSAEHHDSIVVALLLLFYPFYLLLLAGVASIWIGWFAACLLPLMPFCAWALVQLMSDEG